MLQLFNFDPLADSRWSRFLARRADSSVFHSVGWLECLRRTYGYKPIVYTTKRAGVELEDGFLFCEVDSWLSGRRLVSVPFSDHTALLGNDPVAFFMVFSALKEKVEEGGCRYVQIRPASHLNPGPVGFDKSEVFYWHTLDLNGSLDSLYRSFHKDCVQRKIRRAQKENLAYAEGRSEEMIQQFYDLFLLTRKRHGLPPQPISWFRNLIRCFGENAKVRISSLNGEPIAAIITLTHKKSMTYKYGGSDPKYHNLGGMVFLFWQAIQDAKSNGIDEFDMGRSDCDNPGLVTFKEHWGAKRNELAYWAYPAHLRPVANRWSRVAKSIFSSLPTSLLPSVGSLLYRHIG